MSCFEKMESKIYVSKRALMTPMLYIFPFKESNMGIKRIIIYDD